MTGVVTLISQLDLGWLFILGQALVLLALSGYFLTLGQAARNAAYYALPRRRFLEKFRLGRKALSFFLPRDAASEHIQGKVDLKAFDRKELSPNPVARGDLFSRLLKRGFDIFMALGLLVFAMPILLAAAIAVKLESAGPIFYRQTRIGRHGRCFEILKFRSMRVNAEDEGAVWAKANDSRVTGVGAFLRRSRIDEIPQAINILLGQMSFVGPRPERPEFTDLLVHELPHYEDRHLMKPGLTGWAQVNYPYGASVEDAREKLTYDLYYVKNFSLILDLFIIIKTVKVAILGLGSR
jgi:exopolysaccharide biosynthesis polyprenyl glycosylphosphotransferase